LGGGGEAAEFGGEGESFQVGELVGVHEGHYALPRRSSTNHKMRTYSTAGRRREDRLACASFCLLIDRSNTCFVRSWASRTDASLRVGPLSFDISCFIRNISFHLTEFVFFHIDYVIKVKSKYAGCGSTPLLEDAYCRMSTRKLLKATCESLL
jgi:hypothetical protein